MNGFFGRMQMRLAGWMQGRHGTDGFSNFLVAVAFVLLILSMVPGLDLLSWVSLALLAYSLVRCCSKNLAARERENAAYERIAAKPKRQVGLLRKKWENRKTTRYFTCKGCGQTLSVPRGKGTLRVVCPKCQTETTKKS
ncbi:MAG: hypothetical protein RSB04_04030 [Gordonibacter sp.]|uniref:hypothetical protein n=2 Tax=Gordonibacter sp. TaxID=1968902 RepID=UPI002FCA887B